MPRKRRNVAGGTLIGAAAAAIALKLTPGSPVHDATPAQLAPIEPGVKATEDQLIKASKNAADAAETLLAQSAAGDHTLRVGDAPTAAAAVPARPTAPRTSVPPAASGASGPSDPLFEATPRRGAQSPSRAHVIKILKEAAAHHKLDPSLVLALAYWESGWDQSKVSVTGAVGLMQVEPTTAAEAGPGLLNRPVDIEDPYDNADVGAAVLREDLNTFGTPEMALAAYYQGPTSLRNDGLLPDTQQYVAGIMALKDRLATST